MTRQLLPLPSRIAILIASRRGSLSILALAAAAMSALELRVGDSRGVATGLVLVLGLPLVLTTVGADLRKGVAPLWVQRPVDPVRFYLVRFGEGALASVALSTVILGGSAWVLLQTGWEPVTHVLRLVVVAANFAFVTASMSFGLCVLLPRAGKLASLTVFVLTIAWQTLESRDPSESDGLASAMVSAILFPLPPLVELGAAQGVEPESLLRPLAWVFCFAVAWVGLGLLGIRRAFSHGAWARSA